MAPVRIALVGMLAVAAMFVAIRRASIEPEKADAAISVAALRDVGLMRSAAMVAVPPDEKPIVLPPLERIEPPKTDLPARPAPPKADPPAPTKTMYTARPVRVAYSFCSRFGMRKVMLDKWKWRCRR